MEEILCNFCVDFPKIKEIIDSNNFDGDIKIVKGYVQSKKSWAIISIAIYCALKHNKISTIVVRNSIDDFIQIKTRLLGVLKQFDNNIVITRGRSFKMLPNEAPLPVINICMRNPTDLKNFNKEASKYDKSKFVSIIDEIDSNENDGNAISQFDIECLIKHSGMLWGITATPLTNLIRYDKKDVFILSRPEWYKDISTFTFIDLPTSSKCTRYVEDCILSQDPNIESYVEHFSKKDLETCTIWNEKHPRISLIRTGTVILPQISFARKMSQKFPNLTIITYNGVQEGITLRGKGIYDDPILLSNGKFSSVFNESDFIVHKFKGVHISEIIGALENCGINECSHIIIIAGKKADRGISFVSSSFGLPIERLKWHLTEMYLTTSDNTSQNNILQISGRLCGVFKDTISLSIITNIGHDIIKAYHSQDELIIRSLNSLKIPDIPINEDKLVKRKLGTNFTCKLNKVVDDTVHGGWDWVLEGKQYTSQIAQFETDEKTLPALTQEEILFNRQLKKFLAKKVSMNEEEFARLTTKMFPRWSSSQTNIGNFMRAINPRTIYSLEEIQELCLASNIRLSDCHSIANKKRVKYGNFILGVETEYQLHPDLVQHYEKYFGCNI